jgi:hypothetical protein
MSVRKNLVLGLLLIMSVHGMSQKKMATFGDSWASMLAQDDHEKNFRFSHFMDSLNIIAETIRPDSLDGDFPVGWSYAYNETNSMVVMAGVLPFDGEPDRLIWMVQPQNDSCKARVFASPLPASTGGMEKPSLRLTNYELGALTIVSMKVLIGKNTIFELPDISSKLILAQLVASTSDDEKLQFSRQLWKRMALLLGHAPLFDHDFSGYEKISTLLSPDGVVKIITWNIAFENGTNAFVGGIAVQHDGNIQVYDFIDKYTSINNPEQASLSPERWYGAVYYDLIETNYRRKSYYTLLGYNPNNSFTKIRVIEVLSIDSRGEPDFGNAILEQGGRLHRRKIFEYSERVSMMLRYASGQNMIVMDNLAPTDPFFENNYNYYGPDFTHNGFKFEKGKWVYYSDIELRNPAAQGRRQ